MKSLLLSLALFVSTQAFAAEVELGKYKAVDADTKTIEASFELGAGGKVVSFTVKTPDFTLPAPGCTGTYAVAGNEFKADIICPNFQLLPQAKVTIDISNVNAQSLRSPTGAEVTVAIDALGGDKNKFLLKKAD